MPKDSNQAVKERLFVKKYIELGFRGAEAAKAAGYTKTKFAKDQATKMLRRPSVQRMLAEELQRLHKKIDISQEELLRGALVEATLDPTEIVEISRGSVTVKDLAKVPVEIRRCIEEVAEHKHGLRLKFSSKASARDFIAKVKGWYKQPEFTGGAKIIFLNSNEKESEED